jgi:hypothetical protein
VAGLGTDEHLLPRFCLLPAHSDDHCKDRPGLPDVRHKHQTNMSGLQLDLLESQGIDERKSRGLALMACGELLLMIDLVILLMIGSTGYFAGSSLWTWWTIIEGIAGIGFIGVGFHLRGTLYR